MTEYMKKRIVNLYGAGMTSREVADTVQLPESTVKYHITKAIKSGKVKRRDKRINSKPRVAIQPHDYTGASEYTLHFKGAEFEDTRCKELRELGARHPFRYRL